MAIKKSVVKSSNGFSSYHTTPKRVTSQTSIDSFSQATLTTNSTRRVTLKISNQVRKSERISTELSNLIKKEGLKSVDKNIGTTC